MSEPIWLDGYTGQSVDELLALERTHRIDSIILAFENAIESRDHSVPLMPEEQIILAVVALNREVNHGGFGHFFAYESRYTPLIVGALHRIGCPKTAEITEKAIRGMRLPELTENAIEQIIFDDDEDRDACFDECDLRFFEYEEDIDAHLLAFIKANKRRFHL